jgi:hypothetical protein
MISEVSPMRQRHSWVGLAVVGLVLGASAPAQADFNIATGLKWVPLRYTAPVGAGTSTSNGSGPVPGQWYRDVAGEMYGNHWQTTSLDNYLGFFFTEQIGIQLSLDFGYGSLNNHTDGGGQFSTSYFQLGIGIGAKFYLNRPSRERVSPYLFVQGFKYFASVSTNDSSGAFTNDVVAAIAGFRSPVGLDAAFGAEYFFTTSFSLGAEVLGLRLAHVQGDIPNGAGGRISTGETFFTLYTGISLNYRFLATARVYTYEEEEDRASPRPKTRPRRPPPPPPTDETPPPDRESVD